jgi:hypothetical protein
MNSKWDSDEGSADPKRSGNLKNQEIIGKHYLCHFPSLILVKRFARTTPNDLQPIAINSHQTLASFSLLLCREPCINEEDQSVFDPHDSGTFFFDHMPRFCRSHLRDMTSDQQSPVHPLTMWPIHGNITIRVPNWGRWFHPFPMNQSLMSLFTQMNNWM